MTVPRGALITTLPQANLNVAAATVGHVLTVVSGTPNTVGFAAASGGLLTAALAADFDTSSTTFVNVTGLAVTLPAAGRYLVIAQVRHLHTDGVNASQAAINGPALTSLRLLRYGNDSALGSVAPALVTAYDTLLYSATTGRTFDGAIQAILVVSAGGSLTMRLLTPGGTASARMVAGSYLMAIALP